MGSGSFETGPGAFAADPLDSAAEGEGALGRRLGRILSPAPAESLIFPSQGIMPPSQLQGQPPSAPARLSSQGDAGSSSSRQASNGPLSRSFNRAFNRFSNRFSNQFSNRSGSYGWLQTLLRDSTRSKTESGGKRDRDWGAGRDPAGHNPGLHPQGHSGHAGSGSDDPAAPGVESTAAGGKAGRSKGHAGQPIVSPKTGQTVHVGDRVLVAGRMATVAGVRPDGKVLVTY